MFCYGQHRHQESKIHQQGALDNGNTAHDAGKPAGWSVPLSDRRPPGICFDILRERQPQRQVLGQCL